MVAISTEQRVNPVLDGGRPTARHETNPGAYSIFRAGYLREGLHIVNVGDIKRLVVKGVFRVVWYDRMVWDLETGTGAVEETSLTLHISDAVMVVTPGI